ncbi:hypothetical protein A3E46_01615 [Candidatus Woesebacteria bacterium RIFCSPHIGHO2_12_FULL_46_16]|uniref:Uncharacterized protein n=1 Tax=Candidatus Woesebacteria bacterium RIFCSPHIGHO2_12_FULL_46_16 TaxID=1802513 RepID=A0A1F8AVY1_9BACT|nr:MAG: hypothetical protein A3E46_01615 [Candidatus Woesebacteria bacterium RIFCSPHIGHO2_12_FULL_46_16]
MKKLLIFLSPIIFLLSAKPTLAVCPVCTVAVGAGLGISRWLGIDDSVSGIWVGGLMVSLSFWLTDWLTKKNLKFFKKWSNQALVTTSLVLWSLLTYLPLWKTGVIGHPFNTILGIDKLIFGSIIGAGAFFVGVFADKKVREKRGKQLFNFQRVVFPVVSLLIASLVVYFYGGYLL